jgi:uncharacterized protein
VIVIADTSGIIAASDRNAPERSACERVLREAGTVVISPFVLAEVDHLAKARFGSHARTVIIDFIRERARQARFEIPATGVDVLDAAAQVQARYTDLDPDLADAVNVVLAARYRTNDVLTIDRRDFRAIRPLTPDQWFRLLPDDL